MAKKLTTRRELLDRWRGIEEEEEDNDDDNIDPSKCRRLHHHKEQWFADAYNFLIGLPNETHIWCGFWDIMGPLLETFYNYFKDERQDSPLRCLWKRISDEMKHCLQCISQHHQAQDMYRMEYESSSIGPLLDVLKRLDYERVTLHLRNINARIAEKEYNPTCDNAEVVNVLYEVLMFPILLDYQSLFTEFELFVEAIDDKHELALSGHQQFPGVYALFFCKRSVRSVGYRLAGSMGRLRRAADLEPLQPLLKKFIGCLEAEALPSALETSTPRIQPDRVSLWIGIKSLLGFLDPPAFEEGIMEHYPFFLDIVLNHISGDSLEFSHAVTCLRLLFEMLGFKLWLRSTLSPSVMRNTLLGQCFHTRNEKIHKDIFGLFQPFLQSLEALQDGEHEKQRRHFLYFLLHQVPVSSNFSILTRKLACQISLLVVHRGYKMNPPCPPFECAHMWGPALVSSLKDSSLHNSLRQPAFDLIQTIIVSDATALVSSLWNSYVRSSTNYSMAFELDDKMYEIWLPTIQDGEEEDSSPWSQFTVQSRITSVECREWMCIPMLWIDVLVDINPSVLPISFSKAVFWARSRFPMVEPENSTEIALPVRSWLLSSAAEISSSLGWKVPTGSDDGGDGNTSKNSVEVLQMSFPLIRIFNRLTAHFLTQMGQGELCKQWTWEPQMGESMILSLLDPNDNVRQFGKCMLEQVSDTHGLSSGLNFLCSCKLSLSATFLGLKHAMKLVQLDSVLLKFHSLHHFWFLLCKLLKEGDLPAPELQENRQMPKFSSEGGFLKQPTFDSLPVDINAQVSDVDLKTRKKFSNSLSAMAWPIFCQCLVKGKEFIDYNLCQMTCVRLLEILPILVGQLYPSCGKELGNPIVLVENILDFRWLHDLMEWGKSSLKVIIVYWKRAVTYLLNLFKGSRGTTTMSTIITIENLITSDGHPFEELTEQISRLSVSLSREGSCNFRDESLKSKSSISESLPSERKYCSSDAHYESLEDTGVQIVNSQMVSSKENLVILSDDEAEPEVPPSKIILSDSETGHYISDGKRMSSDADESILDADTAREKISRPITSKGLLEKISSQSRESDNLRDKPRASLLIDSKGQEGRRVLCSKSQDRINLNKISDEAVGAKKLNKVCSSMTPKHVEPLSNPSDKMPSDIVHDAEYDRLETALKAVGRTQLHIGKPTSVFRRQVIQLKSPLGNKSGRLHRLEDAVKRFKPSRLDDWYKPILEIDFFAIVGLDSKRKDENRSTRKLKEVPMNFQSSEQYVEIFRPLVLEEFKAQLHNSFIEMSSWEDMYFGNLSVMSVERVDDFHLVRFVHDDSDSVTFKSFTENDLVLLTKDPPQKASQDVHMVGKVERREKDNKRSLSIVLIRFYFQNGASRLNQARRNLTERSRWHACRIMSITPQIREFQALSSLKSIPLLPLILNPINDSFSPCQLNELNLSKLSQPLQQSLRSSFNVSQLQAISVAIGVAKAKRDFELSLIQGPPGTGKTRTIVAIVSGLLASCSQKANSIKNPLNDNLNQNSLCTNSRSRISRGSAIARAWQDAALARQLGDDAQSTSKFLENCVRQRVLICAQSNAAVDELVSRISSQGLYGSNGKMYKPYLVRVGNAKTVHPNSLPFFIDTLVDQRVAEERMHSNGAKNDSRVDSSGALRSNLEKLVDSIRFYEVKRANLRDGSSNSKLNQNNDCRRGDDKEMSDAEIESQLQKLYEQKRQIYKDLSNVQAQEKKANEEIKELRNRLRKSILREAEIVVTTLSGCGGHLYGVCSETMLSSKFGGPSEHTLFDAVVIDEAAQALEPASLIPLQLLKSSGTKSIMVGDPKQLPATVLSNIASKYLYECSMFERLQRAGYPVIMLTEQYRMHPEICKFPSMHFYDDKLLNGSQMSNKSASFHQTKCLGPYVFYDVVGGQELRGKNSGSLSLYNEHEADAAVEVVRFFKKRYPGEFIGGRIGIITPYKCQLSFLRSRFLNAFGSSNIADMEFNTVDGFQGREVDILLFSTVRAANASSGASGTNPSSIGFVADVRRMNVSLTRARLALWIFGNARTLQTNHNWAALVKDAKERNLVVSVKMPYHSMFETASINNHIPENSDNCARPLKHEKKVKGASENITRNFINEEENFVRKKQCLVSEVLGRNIGNEDGNALSAKGKGARSKLRNAKDEYIFNKKEDTSDIVGRRDNRASSDGLPTILNQQVSNSGGKGKEKMKISMGRTILAKRQSKFENLRNNLDHPEEEAGGRHKLSNLSASEKPSRSSARDRSSSHKEVSTPSMESCEKDRGANACGRIPNPSNVSENSKRKQQREAVEAILYSSLISSKKAEASTKVPTKRPSSSSVASGGMRPSKARNVRPDPSAPD
ncbi:hypothetical protein L6164_004648 [Bauhinia variegata]|uniref:Uncharacterized protein n=1 Tax=Bauhinia variegata TaxID=167791 RepID=A0ACB9Q750_BAUVA|nr:hypothetical protein L6164_004648 [Bauhinia variegata]